MDSQVLLAERKLNVLMVEDNADTATSAACLLRHEGHRVSVARTGVEAIRLAEICQPDVMLIDIGLPGDMTGYDVARKMYDMPSERRPLLVAVTGYGTPEDRQHSQEAGIDLHLVKPVEPNALFRLLERFRRVIG